MEELSNKIQNQSHNYDYYRIISLFSTFCVGLCMFGMIVGFVSNSQENKGLWGVLSIIFLISQSLLHFVDKFTREQLSKLPIHLLNATRPILLLRLYYIGLFIDILTLILTLIIAYFFQFPAPIIATIWFILLTTSWYNTNELRTYFVKSLEDVPSCSDADCSFHHKLYQTNNKNNKESDNDNNDNNIHRLKTSSSTKIINNKSLRSQTIILNNKFEKIIYSHDGQTHFHFNPSLNILTSLDGIKSWTSIYILIYCIWIINFFHEFNKFTQSNIKQFWSFIILLIVSIIQFVRICFQIWALSRQQPSRIKSNNKKSSLIKCGIDHDDDDDDKEEEERKEDSNLEIDIIDKNENNRICKCVSYYFCMITCNLINNCNSFESFTLILLSPFSMRMLIMINSIISGLLFVYGINNDNLSPSSIFTEWAMGYAKIDKHKYLVICYSLSILLGLISIIFLMRFLTQLCYLQITGKTSYYQQQKQRQEQQENGQQHHQNGNETIILNAKLNNDLPISSPNILHSSKASKMNKNNKINDKNQLCQQLLDEDNVDINSFLNLTNQRLSDDLTQNMDDRERENTLSTIDSSELISADYAQIPGHRDGQYREEQYRDGQSLDFTSFETPFPFVSNKNIIKESRYDSLSNNTYRSPSVSSIKVEKEEEEQEEEYKEYVISNKNNKRMSLLTYMWFRIPYDKYFRITCCILSIMIILQTISLSPNVLNNGFREIMLIISFLNIFILLRITWSSSTRICWKYNDNLQNYLPFPKLFLISYIMGMIITNFSICYMILTIYNLHSDDYKTQNNNCSYYECINILIWLSIWWPISILINNENARFLDRYRLKKKLIKKTIIGDDKLLLIPFLSPTHSNNSNTTETTTTTTTTTPTSEENKNNNNNNNIISLQRNKYWYNYNYNKKYLHRICGGSFIFKSHYPWINSIDGIRPLIPILLLLLLLSVEIGLIQFDKYCLSNIRLIILIIIILFILLRTILLIVSI